MIITAQTLAAIAANLPQAYLELSPTGRLRLVTAEGVEIVQQYSTTDMWEMEMMDYTCDIHVKGALGDVVTVAKQLGVS